MFLKETDVFLTDDSWRIAIEIDLNPYVEAISTIRADLIALQQRRKDFILPPNYSQLKHSLQHESKLHSFNLYPTARHIWCRLGSARRTNATYVLRCGHLNRCACVAINVYKS